MEPTLSVNNWRRVQIKMSGVWSSNRTATSREYAQTIDFVRPLAAPSTHPSIDERQVAIVMRGAETRKRETMQQRAAIDTWENEGGKTPHRA